MVRAVKDRSPVEWAREQLDQLVTRHSRQLPPFSVGVFSAAEAAALREYAERTFLRHYDMYLFVTRGRRTSPSAPCGGRWPARWSSLPSCSQRTRWTPRPCPSCRTSSATSTRRQPP